MHHGNRACVGAHLARQGQAQCVPSRPRPPPPLTAAVITQCSIRHLYLLPAAEYANKDRLISIAKSFERRKCNHHELESPLPEKECFESVVLKNGQNKHRYVIAFQSREIRALFRDVPGVPSIVINRSVMLLEPMNEASKFKRDGMEREKFLQEIVDARAADKVLKKRKREEGGGEEGADGDGEVKEKKKKKKSGPKGPNPLSVKKKKVVPKPTTAATKPAAEAMESGEASMTAGESGEASTADGQVKKKRKRKHGKAEGGGDQSVSPAISAPLVVSAADD